MKVHYDILICPACESDVFLSKDFIKCSQCGRKYYFRDDIPLMFSPNEQCDFEADVTEIVKQFYEETPFPNYDNLGNKNDLISKSEKGFYAKFLDEQIPFNANVLEVGCGTGQLSNYLGLATRNVFGTDMCLNSLLLAEKFRSKENIFNTRFFQMNLFKPIFKPNSFDLLICQGVLHHTGNPYLGFATMCPLVKEGGYLIIGLYNKYGRLISDFRRLFFQLVKDRYKFIDPRLNIADRGESKREAWFKDQYKHPHETKHTIDEVLNWFKRNDIEFINSIPKSKPFMPITINEKLFKPIPKGNYFDHLIVQLNSIIDGYREGGLFLMIGKKRG